MNKTTTQVTSTAPTRETSTGEKIETSPTAEEPSVEQSSETITQSKSSYGPKATLTPDFSATQTSNQETNFDSTFTENPSPVQTKLSSSPSANSQSYNTLSSTLATETTTASTGSNQ